MRWIASLAAAVSAAACVSAAPAFGAERVALVVGVSQYETLTPLYNTARDAGAMAELLARYDFDVHLVEEPTAAALDAALARFEAAADGAEEAIVFYTGHGMTVRQDGRFVNALAPVDATLDCATRQATRMVAMERIRDALGDVPRQVIIFDACRNDPLEGCEDEALSGFQDPPSRAASAAEGAASAEAVGADKGLAPVKAAGGGSDLSAVIAYATGLGRTASDGAPGDGSPYARALLETLEANPTLLFSEVLTLTAARVAESSPQRPWTTFDGADPQICLSTFDCETREALADELGAIQQREFIEAVQVQLLRLGYLQPYTFRPGAPNDHATQIALSRFLATEEIEAGSERGLNILHALRNAYSLSCRPLPQRDQIPQCRPPGAGPFPY